MLNGYIVSDIENLVVPASEVDALASSRLADIIANGEDAGAWAIALIDAALTELHNSHSPDEVAAMVGLNH